MAVDLTAPLNRKQWDRAILIAAKARQKGWLTEWESNFVKDMVEEYQMNGSMMEPTRKQFEALKEIARTYEGSLG